MSEKKIHDYIGYYIGCRCLNTWFPEGHEEYDKQWILTGYKRSANKCFHLENEKEFTWTDSIKPILRRLEDITDDEWQEIEYETSIAPDAIGWYGIKESIMTIDARHRFHWTITNETLIILRKRGIDIDGLIKSELAIDTSTLNLK